MTYDIYKLEHILEEMRQYNPKADEYGGKHIIPGWAERIERAIKDIKVESESRRQVFSEPVELSGFVGMLKPCLVSSPVLKAEVEEREHFSMKCRVTG